MTIIEKMRRAKASVLKVVQTDQSAGLPEQREAPGTIFSRMLAARARKELTPEAFEEVHRIVSLPVVYGYAPEEREVFQRENILAHQYEDGFRLHDEQCDAVMAFEDHRGLFAPIGVGHGKTLVTLMCAAKAYKEGMPTSLLLVPPQVYSQLTKVDLPWARKRVVLYGCPFHCMSLPAAKRKILAESGRRGCYILPYSMLSTRDAEDLILAINPGLIIGDECHNLRNDRAARTKRMLKFLHGSKPLVAWLSGTITAKSVLDYLHLVRCLGSFSPLPIPLSVAIEWAATLDSDSDVQERRTGPVYPLIEWARKEDSARGERYPQTTSGFRRAYALRMRTNPCVVSTGDKTVGTSLIINFKQADTDCDGWRDLLEFQERVEEDWETPTGDNIDFGMHKWKWLMELSAGFYNELYWPTVSALMSRHGWSEDKARELLEASKAHHAHNQEYLKELRDWLQRHNRKGLDTPLLVANSFARRDYSEIGDEDLYDLWKTQHDIRTTYPNMPERWSRVIRVCPYKVNAAVRWAAENETGIIWFWHNGIGQWIHELLPEAVFAPAGANDAILESKDRLVIASVNAHGTGKNLQFHDKQLYLQVPRGAQLMEQSIGRTHRFGQLADELVVDALVNRNGEKGKPTFDELAYAAMLNDAVYIMQSTDAPQKPVYASYVRMPKVYPSTFLYERGLDPKILNARGQKVLLERFGAE